MWIDPVSLSRFAEELDSHGSVVLEAIPLPPAVYQSPSGKSETSVLIARSTDGDFVALVPGDVAPLDADLAVFFGESQMFGEWRVLPGCTTDSLIQTLDRVGTLLGLQASEASPASEADDEARTTDPPSAANGVIRVPAATDSEHTGESQNPPFTRDLTALARLGSLPALHRREHELQQIITILMQKERNCPLLCGEPGVGKTAIVEGLASMADDELPERLRGLRVLALDTAALIAGAVHKGDMERNTTRLVEMLMSDQHAVLFVDEIHTLAEARGDVPVLQLLKPHLANGLRLVGATTHSEYMQTIARDQALVRRFDCVMVPEPSAQETVEMLATRLPSLRRHHSVEVSDDLLGQIVELADEFLTERKRPDRALVLLDRSMAAASVASSTERPPQLTANMILSQVSAITGIPERELADPRSLLVRLPELDAQLRQRLVGQGEAVDAVVAALKNRLLRRHASRPLLSLLAVGPSGVGKTETAKQIAQVCFGSADALIRLDGSEYMESHSIAKLIGSPPGYIGHDIGGQLTEAVRRRPRSVVLFDEIEKAHPAVLNALLQVMDAARLTDGRGSTIDFRRCVLIMTSNLGNVAGLVQDHEGAKSRTREVIRQTLSPEFVGRIDDIIVYHHLTIEMLRTIVRLQVGDLAESIPGVDSIEISEQAINQLAAEAYSPNSGARELGRVLRRRVDPALAQLVEQSVVRQDTNTQLHIDLDGDSFLFTTDDPPEHNG